MNRPVFGHLKYFGESTRFRPIYFFNSKSSLADIPQLSAKKSTTSIQVFTKGEKIKSEQIKKEPREDGELTNEKDVHFETVVKVGFDDFF